MRCCEKLEFTITFFGNISLRWLLIYTYISWKYCKTFPFTLAESKLLKVFTILRRFWMIINLSLTTQMFNLFFWDWLSSQSKTENARIYYSIVL